MLFFLFQHFKYFTLPYSSLYDLWSLVQCNSSTSSSVKVKVSQSCNPMGYTAHGILQARILEWVDHPFPGDLPNLGLNPGLLHYRWILYQLSHKGSPRILEWVACPFSSTSSRLRNQTGVFCIAGGFLTDWTIKEEFHSSSRGEVRWLFFFFFFSLWLLSKFSLSFWISSV